MKAPGAKVLRRVALEGLGWLLVVGGVAALVLPGPGLLMVFAGLVILSQEYEWAEKRLEPVERIAKRTAAEGVETWPRIALSALGALAIVAVGIVWGLHPDAPGWWPFRESWWIPGGWGTGVTLIASGFIALGLLVYSYRHYRGAPMPETAPDADGA